MEVYPGLHWLQAGYANVYLCVSEHELILVDSGSPGREEEILAYVRNTLKREAGALSHILLTHADWDHAGSVAALQQATGATVIAGERTADWLRRGKGPPHMPRPVQFFLDRLVGFEPVPGEALTVVEEGETLPLCGGIEVLFTPGHTMDHHAYYSPATGILFAGDGLSTRSGKLGLSPNFITADEETAHRSARRLLALTPAIFACGHGQPLRGHTLRDLMTLLHELK